MAPTPIPPRDPRLDRRVEFDPRSRNFPIRALLQPILKPRSFSWACTVQLDQGSEGACVGFSIAQEAAAKPVVVPGITNDVALEVYRRAQVLDEYDDTPPEGGTSVLAGAKAATERGWYGGGYRWCFGLDDLIVSVGHHGPAVLGVTWREGQMDTDASGFIHVTGDVAGGHAILCRGVNVKKKYFILRNSWGSGWGVNGDCYVSFDDTDKMLNDQGEAMVPVKRTKPHA
jgi:hypothetical protein